MCIVVKNLIFCQSDSEMKNQIFIPFAFSWEWAWISFVGHLEFISINYLFIAFAN